MSAKTESFLSWQGADHPKHSILLTSPHSGEKIPTEASWMAPIAHDVFPTDIDRFVDELYLPACEQLSLPMLKTQVHRYVVDLNRYPEDIDSSSVEGANQTVKGFVGGYHWSKTSLGHVLIHEPMTRALHDELTQKYFLPFHSEIEGFIRRMKAARPHQTLYHFDCHSMPSKGTGSHRDSGEARADVVISDLKGTSASARFKDLTIAAFEAEGFRVAYNWPYYGGRITERYGKPALGQETIQIELNRSLYLEESKTRNRKASFAEMQTRLMRVLSEILKGL